MRLTLLAIAACLLISTPAFAEDDTAKARALFDEAGELERQGQWSAAADRLRAALRLRDTPHLHYALGWALENENKLFDARTEYQAAILLAGSKNADEVSRLATLRLADVERRLPRGPSAEPDPVAKAIGPQDRHIEGKETGLAPWIFIGGGAVAVLGGTMLLVSSFEDAETRDRHQQAWCQATACTNTTPTIAETPQAAENRREAVEASDRGNVKQTIGFGVGVAGIISAAIGTWLLVRDEHRVRVGYNTMAMTF